MNILVLFKDGGLLITIPILVLLVTMIILWVIAFQTQYENKKFISLIASISWFTLAWGYLGRTIGLIGAFDKIAAVGEIAPNIIAGGLKMALIGPLFGLVSFLIARLGIIILNLKKKNYEQTAK